jgi:hypothetical protein
MAITHSTPADASMSEAGKAAWNADHTGTWPAGDVSFTQSGSGASAETVSSALQRMVFSGQYSSEANYDTARDALTNRAGVGGIDVTRTGGTVDTGSVLLNDFQITFTGHSGGASDVSGLRVLHESDGANAVSQSIAGRFTGQTTGAGAVTTLRGVLGEVRMDGAGNVAGALCVSANFVLASTGSITTNVQMFRAASPDISGTGTIPAIEGLRVSDLGNAKVTDVFGVRVENQTNATGAMYGVRSELTAASGKWNFYASGNALNFFNGKVLMGSSTDDTVNQLQVTGMVISYSDTQAASEGGSFKAANNTTKAKFVQIGYDGTADIGYIKAIHSATANKNLMVAGTGAAIATNSTGSFPLIPSCAGTPTGAPTGAAAGRIPMVYDSTNNIIYFYFGSWRGVAVT